MTEASKIIDGLKEAIADDFPAVTIDGVRWVRESALLAAERRGVNVKPLEWVEEWSGANEDIPVWRGRNPLNIHVDFSFAGKLFEGQRLDRHKDAPLDRVKAAKAAAQADYEARIRSTLAPDEDRQAELAAAERRGIERAADVAKARAAECAALVEKANAFEMQSVVPILDHFKRANENTLAAILALAPEGDGWKPIESAPKDGTPILITRPTVFESEEGWHVVRWSDDCWMCHDGKFDTPLRGDQPTLFQFLPKFRPLPSPPKATE